MRKRNISIITRLNEKEKNHLATLVKRSGLSQEAYIRHLINGVVPKDSPPADYYAMMKELHAIGNNLNQLARKAVLTSRPLTSSTSVTVGAVGLPVKAGLANGALSAMLALVFCAAVATVSV